LRGHVQRADSGSLPAPNGKSNAALAVEQLTLRIPPARAGEIFDRSNELVKMAQPNLASTIAERDRFIPILCSLHDEHRTERSSWTISSRLGHRNTNGSSPRIAACMSNFSRG